MYTKQNSTCHLLYSTFVPPIFSPDNHLCLQRITYIMENITEYTCMNVFFFERILVIFMFVWHGEPHPGQFVGNCKTSPWRSSSVNCPSYVGCNIALFSSLSPKISSWENIPNKRKK